jgi:hypothetical protein
MDPEKEALNRRRLRRAAAKARNISDPEIRAIAQRKVRRFAEELLDRTGGKR